MFENMTNDGLEKSGDHLGGGGLLETNGYDGKIKVAYAGKSTSSKSQSVTVVIDVNGHELRETFWVCNKNGVHTYEDKKDPTKKYGIPGFVTIDNLCLITTGKGLAEQAFAEKTVNIYDYDAKQELPKSVQVLDDLTGKDVGLLVVKQTVDKTKKDESGNYNPTGETRDENVIEKFVDMASKRTVTEAQEGVESAVFYHKWVEKNQGKTKNKAKGAEGKSGSPNGSPPSSSESKPTTSLFGN